MKIRFYLILIFLFIIPNSLAQDIKRVLVEGQIIVDYPDLEGVTVFNLSSNKGTITNKEGKFAISVFLNDKIEISALQFEKFSIIISKEILDAKSMTVFLVESINKLDEILILPYGLSGNLKTDINSTKTFNPNLDAIYFGLDNMNKFEFADDYKSQVVNTTMTPDHFKYGADFVQIIGGLLKPIFKKSKQEKDEKLIITETFRSKYSTEFLLKRLDISKEDISFFIDYVENKGIDSNLLKKGNEFMFIDFLIKESKSFLKQGIEKD